MICFEYLEEEEDILRRPPIYVTAPLLQDTDPLSMYNKGYYRDTFGITKDGTFGARALETRPTLLLSLIQRKPSGTHESIKAGPVQGRPLLVSNIKGNSEGWECQLDVCDDTGEGVGVEDV